MAAVAALAVLATSAVIFAWQRESDAKKLRSPAVISAVRHLARLETIEMNLEKVVDLRSTQKRLWNTIEAEDAILLVASGRVTAGINLATLSLEDVRIEQSTQTVFIRLPPAEVLSATLDAERTYVFERSTDLLARRDATLESRARSKARESILDAARKAGIIAKADIGGERVVRQLVKALGYQKVVFERPSILQ